MNCIQSISLSWKAFNRFNCSIYGQLKPYHGLKLSRQRHECCVALGYNNDNKAKKEPSLTIDRESLISYFIKYDVEVAYVIRQFWDDYISKSSYAPPHIANVVAKAFPILLQSFNKLDLVTQDTFQHYVSHILLTLRDNNCHITVKNIDNLISFNSINQQ